MAGFNFYLLFMKAQCLRFFFVFSVEGPDGQDELRKWSVLQDPPKPSRPTLPKITVAFGDPSLTADFSIDEPIKICIRVSCGSGSSRVHVCRGYMYTIRTDILDMPAISHGQIYCYVARVLSYSAVATAIWQHWKWCL